MPLTNKVTNTMKCDLPKCDVEFEYNPNPQPPETWPAGVHARLSKVLIVIHALTNQPKYFCSEEHAIEGIKQLIHLPPVPPKIVTDASEAAVKAAAAGAKAVAEMKSPNRS